MEIVQPPSSSILFWSEIALFLTENLEIVPKDGNFSGWHFHHANTRTRPQEWYGTKLLVQLWETQSHTLECGHQTKGQQNKTTSRFALLTFGLVATLKGVELCLPKLPSQFYPFHSCGLVLVFTCWKCQPENFPSFETLSKFSGRNSAFSDQNRTELEGNCTISQEIMKYDLEKSVSKIR